MRITPKSLPFTLHKRFRPAAAFVVILLLTLIVMQVPFFANMRAGVQAAATRVGTSFGNAWTRVFQSGESIHAERNQFRELSEALAVDTAELAALQARVDELETLLGYQASTDLATVTARFLARSPEGEHTILLDKGSRDGVSAGMPVVTAGGHMIGEITDTGTHTSVLRLLSDATSSVPATILGEDKTVGLVEGQSGFLLSMSFIPQDERLEEQDVVVTSGLDEKTPGDLVIGVIASIKKNESAPFQSAEIQPLVDLRAIHSAVIITGHAPL